MTELEQSQREVAKQEIQWHREEAAKHAEQAKRELQIADYHLGQINTWGAYLANLGGQVTEKQVHLQVVPEPRDG